MSSRPNASPEGAAPEGADNAAGGAPSSVPPPAPVVGGAASTGSRAVSIVVLPPFFSGKVAMVSGVIFSTGPVAPLPLLLEADSPVEDVTFFPQPMNGATMMEQRNTAEMTRGITHCGIAHLSLREWQSPAECCGFARDFLNHETYSRSGAFPARGRCAWRRSS